MGKWTPLHVDSVLTDKVKSLVQTALQESKESGVDVPFTYDLFVEHLDAKSSFSKKVVELLVTETAESLTRTKDPESLLVAQRTQNALRALSRESRAYPPESYTRVPGRNIRRSEVLPSLTTHTLPPAHPEVPSDLGWENIGDDDVIDFDEDEPLDATYLEAERNRSLYDAYVMPPVSLPRQTREAWDGFMTARVRADEGASTVDPRPFRVRSDTTAAASVGATASGTALARQPSARRMPPRPRTVDFNDFTTRVRERARTRLAEVRAARATEASEETRNGSGHTLPIFARDSPSDSEDGEPWHARPTSTSLLSVPRMRPTNRLRLGGLPAPELVLNNESRLARSSTGASAASTILDGAQPPVLVRSPSPLITMYEGTQGGAIDTLPPLIRMEDRRRTLTHLATPRSSTPGSVDGVGPPTGTHEMA